MAINQQVVEFLNNLEHPLKQEIEEVRSIILSANQEFTEHIKWKAPSFCINKEDRITFNLQGNGFFRLIFHCGAKVKEQAGKGRLIDDTTGLLDWAANDRAIIKFTDMNDVQAKKDKLVDVIIKWIEASC
jgi:hypothetical protein